MSTPGNSEFSSLQPVDVTKIYGLISEREFDD